MARAKRSGMDEAEYLDRYGLVLTDAKKARLHAEMCQTAADLVEQMSIATLVGNAYHSGSWTPKDMRDGVVCLLRGMAVEARDGRSDGFLSPPDGILGGTVNLAGRPAGMCLSPFRRNVKASMFRLWTRQPALANDASADTEL